MKTLDEKLNNFYIITLNTHVMVTFIKTISILWMKSKKSSRKHTGLFF